MTGKLKYKQSRFGSDRDVPRPLALPIVFCFANPMIKNKKKNPQRDQMPRAKPLTIIKPVARTLHEKTFCLKLIYDLFIITD